MTTFQRRGTHESHKKLKVVGAENQIPVICGDIFTGFNGFLWVPNSLNVKSVGAAAPTLTRP